MLLLSKKSNIKSCHIGVLLLMALLLQACGLNFSPHPTIEERQKERETSIEKHLTAKLSNVDEYESLAFGTMKVYKPPVFAKLDSLYDIKYTYQKENRYRELHDSGIEEEIAKTQQYTNKYIDQITYEIEHIYALNGKDSTTIHHDYFVLDHKDSVLNHTKFYHYTIPISLKEIHLNYLFELHFITKSNLYISTPELNFIRYFKEKEQELIGDEKLQKFMIHTLNIMLLAEIINSVDFLNLSKVIAFNHLQSNYNNPDVTFFGNLVAHEDEFKNVIAYTLELRWRDNSQPSKPVMSSTFEFTPYLNISKVETDKI